MRKNQNTFILLFIFFIAVAGGAIFALDGAGSVFDRGINTLGAKNAVMNDVVVGTDPQVQEDSPKHFEPEHKDDDKAQQEQRSESSDDGVRFFILTVNTKNSILRLREEPNVESAVIERLEKGSLGYVLQPGNAWCKVYVQSGNTGYVATKYIKVKEIIREDFPVNIRDSVMAPTEILSDAFEGTDER
ncbi:MAG: SH3 domain-containing protein [Butyrivibrio sp.]|nr:SH3 domain-containing protein [Butyrivibrio sp.]